MSLLLILPLLLAQAAGGDPLDMPGQPSIFQGRATAHRPARSTLPNSPATAPPPGRLKDCLDLAASDAEAAHDAAAAWLAEAKGAGRAAANLCLGTAAGALGQWDEAQTDFSAARDAAADPASRARAGAMAGNAALVAGGALPALAALDAAQREALSAGDAALAGVIAADRARALVKLNRLDEAAAALSDARARIPADAEVWLLSATLARRRGKLTEAQAQIERAAGLLPIDPDIGLEAGVIAALSGRDEAARKSWRSVIAAAPHSEAAVAAAADLAQLGPSAATP